MVGIHGLSWRHLVYAYQGIAHPPGDKDPLGIFVVAVGMVGNAHIFGAHVQKISHCSLLLSYG